MTAGARGRAGPSSGGAARSPLLRYDRSDSDVLVVRVVGALDAKGAERVWDAIEWALEHADVADLTRVHTFDQPGVAMLLTLSRTTQRKRDNLCFAIDDGGDPRAPWMRRLSESGSVKPCASLVC